MSRGVLWRLATVYTTFIGPVVIGCILAVWLLPNILVIAFSDDARLGPRPFTVLSSILISSAIGVAFTWLAAGSGCLHVMRVARALVCPALQRFAWKALAILALATIGLPVLAVAALHGAWMWCAALLALIAGCALLVATLPFLAWLAVLVLTSTLARFLGLRAGIDAVAPGAPHATLLLAAAALCVAGIAWLRVRVLIARSPAVSGARAALLDLAVIGRSGDPGELVMQSSTLRGPPRWLQPKPAAGGSPGQTMRALIGPPLLPGLRQQLLQLAPLLIVPLLLIALPARELLFPVLALLIVVLPLATMQRHGLLYRAQSGELTELALLPGLGAGRARLAAYHRALWIPTAVNAVCASALLWLLAWLFLQHHGRPLLASTIAAITVTLLSASHVLGRGRQSSLDRTTFGALLFYAPVAIGVLVLDHTSTSSRVIAILGPIAVAVGSGCWIASWRYARQVQRLPHPFLAEADR